eukprot:14641730-Alexandrium_andersonii.AAC.1
MGRPRASQSQSGRGGRSRPSSAPQRAARHWGSATQSRACIDARASLHRRSFAVMRQSSPFDAEFHGPEDEARVCCLDFAV